MKKNKSVPFRIIGSIHGKLILLRTYPAFVSMTIGGKEKRFPSRESAFQYLRDITRQNKPNEVIRHE